MVGTGFPPDYLDHVEVLPGVDNVARITKPYKLGSRDFRPIDTVVDVRGVKAVDAGLKARATYHDSCSGLRELRIREQPRQLLRSVRGLELVELADADVCCGFGGTFSIKYPDISNAIVERKAEQIAATGADMLLAGDLGCLMNMAGKLSRQGRNVAVRHVAEVLAGQLDQPAICERP